VFDTFNLNAMLTCSHKLIIGLILTSFFLFTPSIAKAATYTVTKTADTNDGTCDADCSLREAIAAANANAGHDTIEFDIPESDDGYVPASGDAHAYWSIGVLSTLALSDDEGVFINGYSQAGSLRNTARFGETLNTILKIDLYFQGGAYFNVNADNNHITGFSIRSSSSNSGTLRLPVAFNNWVEGNFFGSNIIGTHSSYSGIVQLQGGANTNIIGTNGDGLEDSSEKNLFMGNVTSLAGYINEYPSALNNVIAGNYIATDRTGDQCTDATELRYLAIQVNGKNGRIGTNYDGVSDAEESNIVGCINGGTTGDYRAFVRLSGGIENYQINGNFVGISPHGQQLGSLVGTETSAVSMSWGSASNITIKGNVISNGARGIACSGDTCTQNTFSENNIYGNELLDIDLMVSGENPSVTPNDPGDTDTGPNDLMNYPEIQGAEYLGGSRYKIWGWLEANLSEAPFTIEVCKSSNHSSGYGGCLESLGTMTTSDRAWSMEVTVSGDSENILSTFTALATNTNGSTSEFGPNFGGSVHGPGGPGPSPKKPDLLALQAGFTVKNDLISFAPPRAFLWDVYLDVNRTAQSESQKISSSYWQASGIYNVWYKSYFNDARILADVVQEPFLIALKYDPNLLDPNLSEKNIKLAFSDNDGVSWKVLNNSVLDVVNKTVAVVTKNGGMYMLVSH